MIQPTKGRLLIRKTRESDTTASGIVIAPTAKTSQNTTTSRGTVEAGNTIDLTVAVGAAVIFDEGYGNEVETDLFLVEEKAIKAVIID